jgi:enoyl-CoA hydratase/carnithine racemase
MNEPQSFFPEVDVKWEHHDFPQGTVLFPNDLLDIFIRDTEIPLVLSLSGVDSGKITDTEALRILQAAVSYRSLVSLFLNGRNGGLILGLAACADMTITTEESSLSLSGIGEETAGFAAARLAHQIGKSHTMQLLIDGEVKARQLLRYGLIGKIVSEQEFADPVSFLEKLLPGPAFNAALRLKKVWRTQEGKSVDNALAAERLEFQRCFSEGAAGEIADFLVNRMKTGKRDSDGI